MKKSHWIACTLILLLTTIAQSGSVPFSPLIEITTFETQDNSIFTVDVDGDGDTDILSINDKIAWYENQLNQKEQDFGSRELIGTFTGYKSSINAIDLDGDDDADLLYLGSQLQTTEALIRFDRILWRENRLNQAEEDFGPEETIFEHITYFTAQSYNMYNLECEDLDGDGDADIIYGTDASNDNIKWCENRLNQAEQDFSITQLISVFYLPPEMLNYFYLADLDGDGDMDLISSLMKLDNLGHSDVNTYAWHENRLNQTQHNFASKQINPDLCGIRYDLDNDCDADKYIIESIGGDEREISWYENRLNQIEEDIGPKQAIITFAAGEYYSTFVEDLDHDSDKDILLVLSPVSNSSSSWKMVWYENRLTQDEQDFGPQQVILNDGYQIINVVDLDNDNDNDIVYTHESGYVLSFALNHLELTQLTENKGSTQWHFADGDVRDDTQTYILVNNVNTEATTLSLKVLFEDREPVTITATAGAFSRCTIALHDRLPAMGVEPCGFGCSLISNLPVFAERAMYAPELALRDGAPVTTFRTRATAAIGAREPCTEWLLAEGATGVGAGGQPRETFIYIANPNATDAEVEVEFLREGAAPVTLPLTIPAQRRASINCAEAAGLEQANFSTRVFSTNGVAVVADRTMVGAADGLARQWAHASLAAEGVSTAWYFGDGSLADGCETFLTLANPSSTAATVNLRFLRESEEPFTAQVAVAPLSRETVILSDYTELLERRFSIEALVEDGSPGIVAERPMYWRAAGYTQRSGASDTVGATHTAATWFMPEGAVYGQSDFECEFAVGNPSTSDTLVEVAFMLSNGEVLLVERELAAGRRITIPANDHLVNPGGTVSFSTLIRTTNGVPIIADRSMYARSLPSEGGIARFSGHASQAISLEDE
ncbi:VCBS repeat-containing protein [Candidatus Sumerlaeota bacterium]|nr:VCBS repeat-containing protein [Candidatus Sumerlaeota bacterium]